MPKVSVIIPNYNHAPYLPKRIESVLAQTFQDFELLIMDDASPDNSREIIKQYASKNKHIRTIFNEFNSGSPFHQWNKGAELASGEYLWFAESDDFCEPTLLEKLVPVLDENPGAGIAYGQTYLVNEENEILNSYAINLEFIYKTDQWEHDFLKNGSAACREWLLFHNPIPNASGALIRKKAFLEAGKADTSMKLNGDWFLYARILSKWDLAFCKEHLNYFRMHIHTQRQRVRADANVYYEIITINDFIREHVPDSANNADAALGKISKWWVGSIPFQKWSWKNFKENIKLYFFFKKYSKMILPRIAMIFIKDSTRAVLIKMHLLKPAKKLRSFLFPGKYFEY